MCIAAYIERRDGKVAEVDLDYEDGDVLWELLGRAYPRTCAVIRSDMVSVTHRPHVDYMVYTYDDADNDAEDEALRDWVLTWTAEVVDQDRLRPAVLARCDGRSRKEAVGKAIEWAEEDLMRKDIGIPCAGRRYYVRCGGEVPWTVDDYILDLVACDVTCMLYDIKETDDPEERMYIKRDILRLLNQGEEAGLQIDDLRARATRELAEVII